MTKKNNIKEINVESKHVDKEEVVKLSEGSGGEEMEKLIASFSGNLFRGKWKHSDNDGAVFDIGNVSSKLVFTTDSYVVTPIFFPGGNIGKLAFCGTVNDLSVMGATPIGISLAVIIEEGFPKEELHKIINTLGNLSIEHQIPIVTGDTKVVEKGKIDRIMITTSGVGLIDEKIGVLDKKINIGDKIIVSGNIGDHAVALLSKRFDFECDVSSDSKPLHKEMEEIKKHISQAKDITRGGLASVLNELCEKNNCSMIIYEEKIPVHSGVKKAVEFLGINLYELACEGRLVCVCSDKHAYDVLSILRKFNNAAAVIGEITDSNIIKSKSNDVVCQTKFGKKIIHKPTGNIVPRIC